MGSPVVEDKAAFNVQDEKINVHIESCVLSNAREFILKIGSNRALKQVKPEQRKLLDANKKAYEPYAESNKTDKYFNGHTNIVDDKFLCFGVKGLLDTNRRLKDAMLFNLLSYMTNELLGKGNTVAAIDELYLFLTNMTAIEYIRNASKRVRKKDSSVILASQNIEDFMLDGIKEYTKPLFSIPTHQFLFNAGNIEPKTYIDIMQIEPSEFELIKYPERGTCLYRCGNERYLLQVIAPEFKQKMFGKAGGR